jgi:hypothetical protein
MLKQVKTSPSAGIKTKGGEGSGPGVGKSCKIIKDLGRPDEAIFVFGNLSVWAVPHICLFETA